MGCKYLCDNCGKEEKPCLGFEDWIKPEKWYIRPYIDDFQIACSQECAAKLQEKYPEKLSPLEQKAKDESDFVQCKHCGSWIAENALPFPGGKNGD